MQLAPVAPELNVSVFANVYRSLACDSLAGQYLHNSQMHAMCRLASHASRTCVCLCLLHGATHASVYGHSRRHASAISICNSSFWSANDRAWQRERHMHLNSRMQGARAWQRERHAYAWEQCMQLARVVERELQYASAHTRKTRKRTNSKRRPHFYFLSPKLNVILRYCLLTRKCDSFLIFLLTSWP